MASSNIKRSRQRRRTFDEDASHAFAGSVLAGAEVPSAIIGRIAVWAWVDDISEHEMTKDVDYAVPVEHIQSIAAYLSSEGHSSIDLDIGGLNVEVEEDGVNVDFVHRRSDILGDLSGLFSEAIGAAEDAGILVTENDVPISPIPLVPLEYLVAMKVATGEHKDEKDAFRLVAYGVEEVDVGHVRALLNRFGGASDLARFERVLRDAGHPDAYVRGRYKKGERR